MSNNNEVQERRMGQMLGAIEGAVFVLLANGYTQEQIVDHVEEAIASYTRDSFKAKS